MIRLTPAELDRFHRGDERVLRAVVEAWTPRLLATASSFARDADHAHDLVQETWRRAWEKRHSYQGSGSLPGWLFAVCRSVCLSERRARDRQGGTGPEVGREAASLADPTAGPDAETERRALSGALRAAVLELPDRERETLVLRLVEGRSTRETAEIMGCAPGTVKAALHHALEKLKPRMEIWTR